MIKINFNKISIDLFLILLIFSCFVPVVANSQFDDRPPPRIQRFHESIFIDPIVFYYEDSLNGRLDLYIELPVNILLFKYDPSRFTYTGSFEYNISIKNSLNNTLTDNSYSESIVNSETEQKNLLSKSLFRIKQFFLPPDKYNLKIKLKDNNSLNEYSKEAAFIIKENYHRNLVFSDIMILSDYRIAPDGKKEITPVIDGFLGDSKEFYLFFEVTNRIDSAIINHYTYSIRNNDGEIFGKGGFDCTFQHGTNRFFEKIIVDKIIPGNYIIEITDKESAQLVAKKIINNMPDRIPFPGRGYRRNYNKI